MEPNFVLTETRTDQHDIMKDIRSPNKKHLGIHTSDTFHVSQQIMYLNYLNQIRIPLGRSIPRRYLFLHWALGWLIIFWRDTSLSCSSNPLLIFFCPSGCCNFIFFFIMYVSGQTYCVYVCWYVLRNFFKSWPLKLQI
jgi:hypothetical protein